MQKIQRYFLPASLLFLFAGAATVHAQKSALKIDYTVQLIDPSSRQFHVVTNITNISQPRLDLSLPTWTPGWYTVENYAKNLLRFRITDASGRALPHTMSHKQTSRGIRR